MAQVEAPANLSRWPDPATRLVTLILIRCGLRACDACTLKFDCLIHDGQGAPYLRYCNTKMRREAAVPIDEELQADIRAQQNRVVSRWPAGNPNLFPRSKANASGKWPLSSDTYRSMLDRWLATCDIHDERGQPVHLTAHQWRHTFACRLKGRGVASDATFRGWRGDGLAGPAALPGVRRACGPTAGHAVDQGFLAPGCAG